MREREILFEKDGFWIRKHEKGWLEVYQNGVTCSKRVATVDFRLNPAKQMRVAKAEIERRLRSDSLVAQRL